MIPGRHSSGYQQIGIKGESMSIIMDEKSAHTMSSVIYSDHRKKEAVIRELCTNATDAHIMAGKEDVPIEVTLPTVEFPYLMIKDQGIGISKEDGIKYFTSFFASGSQLEEKPTGYYGLGAKSPHAYTDAYEIIMIKDGLKSMMLCFKDEEGIPSYRLLTEDQATDEPNGVSFKVPVMEKDFRDFARAALHVLPMFSTKPNLVGISERIQEAYDSMRAYEKSAVDLGGVKIMLSDKSLAPIALRAHPSHGTLNILMGNILYPVDIRTYNKHGLVNNSGHLQQLYRVIDDADLTMTLDIDIVKYGMRVEPGRERIITNAKNMAIMESIAERVVKTLYAQATKEAAGRTAWQISKHVMLGEGFLSLMRRDPITYLKYQILGAGEHVKHSQLNPLLEQYDVKATVARSDAILVKTSSMSSSRFISTNQGAFNPVKLDKIVLLDDKKIKVSDISWRLLNQCIAEDDVYLGHGAKTRTLGLIIRANSKKGDPKAFADKMFGEGEYTLASDLIKRDFNTLQHESLKKKTVRLVQFSSSYNCWKFNEGFALSPMELKQYGTRAVPRRRIVTDAFIPMSEQEFEERKEEMAFLFLQSRRSSPNILLSEDPIDVRMTYGSLDEYVKSNFRFHYFESTFSTLVAKHWVSELVVTLMKEVNVDVAEDHELNSIHNTLIAILEKDEKLSAVLPNADEDTRKLLLKSRATNLSLGSIEYTVTVAKETLVKHDLIPAEKISKTLNAFADNQQAIMSLMRDIIAMLQSHPLEMQYYFSIPADTMKAIEKTILKNHFSTHDIAGRIKDSATPHKHQKVA